jgi:hypothetical protein
LLDEESQHRFKMRRDLDWLRRKLARALPLLDVSFTIETHAYPSSYERWVSQSDLGLILRFEDNIVPARTWETAALLQAKRIFPARGGGYELNSRFLSHDKLQQKRMLELNRFLDYPLARYLLYVPRPEWLDPEMAATLRHRRDVNLLGQRFDRPPGLELHRDLRRNGTSLDAGLIVAPANHKFGRYDDTYATLFKSTLPWSWFMASALVDLFWPVALGSNFSISVPDDLDTSTLVGLVSGDADIAQTVIAGTGWSDRDPVPFLPARSVTVVATVGAEFDLGSLARDDE